METSVVTVRSVSAFEETEKVLNYLRKRKEMLLNLLTPCAKELKNFKKETNS